MRLIDDTVQHVRYRHATHRVELNVTSGVCHRLENHAPHRWVLQSEADDLAHFVLVDISLDRCHKGYIEVDLGQAVQRPQLRLEQIGAADHLVRPLIEPVELEVDGGTQLGQCGEEVVVVGDAQPVRVDHDVGNAALLRRCDHLEDLRMYRRLTTAELDDLRVALQLDQPVEHRFDLG